MDEQNQGEILVKRNKLGTFLNLFICILCFYRLLILLDGGDIDMLVPPFTDIKTTFFMYVGIIALIILSIIFSLQLTKKGTIIINEYGIIDKYSTFSKGEIYLWKDIRSIYYTWKGGYNHGFDKVIVLQLQANKRAKKVFVLPVFTRIGIDAGKIGKKIVYYCNIHPNDEIYFSDISSFRNLFHGQYSQKICSYKKIYSLDERKREKLNGNTLTK